MTDPPSTQLDRLAAQVVERHPTCGIAAQLLAIRERDRGANEVLATLVESGSQRLSERFRNVSGTAGIPPIADTASAMRDLGFRRVHSGSLASTTVTELSEPTTHLDALEFWRYAGAVGTLATVSAMMDGLLVDEAFPAGFFHAIGRLVMDQHTPDRFAQVARLVRDSRLPVAEAEAAVYGFAEAELASALALRWGFPGWLVQVLLEGAVGPEDVAHTRRSLPALVLAARLAAQTRGFGTEFEPMQPPPASARWLVEPLLLALDRLGGDEWLEGRVRALQRVALLQDQ